MAAPIYWSPNCRLFSCVGPDDLLLDGIVFEAQSATQLVVHIHGCFGNFYQNTMIRRLAFQYTRRNISFACVNLSSHSGLAEGNHFNDPARVTYLGGMVGTLSRCTSEIEAITSALQTEFSVPIVLQGHSLGVDRVVAFVRDTGFEGKLILLSPCDSVGIQERWLGGKNIYTQCESIHSYPDNSDYWDLLPRGTYGATGNSGEWRYEIPATKDVFLSIMEGWPRRLFSLKYAEAYNIRNKTLVCMGRNDELHTFDIALWESFLNERFTNAQVITIETGHDLGGYASTVGEKVAEWLNADNAAQTE